MKVCPRETYLLLHYTILLYYATMLLCYYTTMLLCYYTTTLLPLRRGNWLKMAPHLCEDTTLWHTHAFLEAWVAPCALQSAAQMS